VESGGEHPNTFNIKHVLAQVVGFARIYAINYAMNPQILYRESISCWKKRFSTRRATRRLSSPTTI
jgi:hypothetical protein